MSSDLNITAAISMSSGDPSHRHVLQQTWSSVNHLVNFSGKEAGFLVILTFSDVPHQSRLNRTSAAEQILPTLDVYRERGAVCGISLKTSGEGPDCSRLSGQASQLVAEPLSCVRRVFFFFLYRNGVVGP